MERPKVLFPSSPGKSKVLFGNVFHDTRCAPGTGSTRIQVIPKLILISSCSWNRTKSLTFRLKNEGQTQVCQTASYFRYHVHLQMTKKKKSFGLQRYYRKFNPEIFRSFCSSHWPDPKKGEGRTVKKISLVLLNGLLNAKDTFRNIKEKLGTAPLCQGSNFSKNFIVQPDVSETKLGAI